MNNFYDSYINNKNKHALLNLIDKLNKMSICHFTDRKNLSGIVVSGKVVTGKNVPIEKRRLSGGIPIDYVFTVIMPKSSVPNIGCCDVFRIL